ncbi:MAG TPA: hypothetical protein VF157_05710 [Chloroflexota bacterium]
MATVIRKLSIPVESENGARYRASVTGQQRGDGTWEGWLEFAPLGGGATLRTERETTQSNQEHLEYWASGLEPAYLEGAFRRAVAHTPVTAPAGGRRARQSIH